MEKTSRDEIPRALPATVHPEKSNDPHNRNPEQKKRRRTTSTKIHPDAVTPTSLRKARQHYSTPHLCAKAPGGENFVRLLQPISSKVKTVTFLQAFGILGPPMLLVTIISLAWTTWLIVLAIAPTPTANYLMDTEGYDDGRFWLIVDPDPSMVVLSVLGLGTVAAGYLYVLLVMLLWRNRKSKAKLYALVFRSSLESLTMRFSQQYSWVQATGSHLYLQWRELTAFDGIYRKFWAKRMLEDDRFGAAIGIALSDARKWLTNNIDQYILGSDMRELAIVYRIHTRGQTLRIRGSSRRFHCILTNSFDMLFAVMFPILVLAYCYNKFEFDRAAYLLNMEVFPAGSFERRARMIADPSQIALFRVGFDSLRIQTVLDFTVRIAMNLSFCNRFKRVVEILLARHSRSTNSSHLKSFRNPLQKDVPRAVALLFLLFSIVIFAETQNAVDTSNSACHAYPQCVVHAFRSTSQEWCPCLTLIDVDRTPTTVDDWWNPIDATDIVKALAQSGDLRVLQLINRRLFRLPEELQRCRSLQYMHVEGRQTSRNLLQIPDDLFQDLPVLTFLQLGIHRYLQRLPPLLGVPNLRSLVFARTFSITELPSFERLQKLERLELAYLPMLRTVPDMKPLINLVHFAVYRASPICCNGFASACNLTDSFCQADPIQILPAASCLKDDESRASPATQHFFETFASTICQKPASNLVLVSDIPTNKTIEMCGGVQFRECRIPNSDDSSTTGICFRSRMQVLACTPDPNKVKLRKLQIARRVGPVCDPVVEKWLGCE